MKHVAHAWGKSNSNKRSTPLALKPIEFAGINSTPISHGFGVSSQQRSLLRSLAGCFLEGWSLQERNPIALVAAFLLTLIAIPFIWTVGPILEMRYFPVTTPLTIVSHKEVKDGTVIVFEFDKARPCEFLPSKFEWYQGHERRAGVLLKKWGGGDITSNPPGNYVSDPWFVGLTWDEIQYNSTAYWAHKCHPLWDSPTRIWPEQEYYSDG